MSSNYTIIIKGFFMEDMCTFINHLKDEKEANDSYLYNKI